MAALDKAIGRLKQPGVELRFVYEAGPTGYVIYRHLQKLGYPCVVVAPSLTPRKSGQRIKTDRRDVETLQRIDVASTHYAFASISAERIAGVL